MGQILDIGIDAAYDHEGRVVPVGTDKLQAACSCGWTDDRAWDTDAGPDDHGIPSDGLSDRILASWEAHVYDTLGNDRVSDLDYLRLLIARLGNQGVDEDDLDGLQRDLASGLAAVQRIRRNPAQTT